MAALQGGCPRRLGIHRRRRDRFGLRSVDSHRAPRRDAPVPRQPPTAEGAAMTAEPTAWATVHVASQALSPWRAGLTRDAARQGIRHLRKLLGTPAVALTAGSELLAWYGAGRQIHGPAIADHATGTLESGRTRVLALDCEGRCPIRLAVVAPLIVEHAAVGVLGAYTDLSSPHLVRTVTELAEWISTCLELAEGGRSLVRQTDEASEPLRPGVSPHFVFNSLTAIMSFVRTDPEHANDLLQDFADVARYSFRRETSFTTLEEELSAVKPYLILEQARFADRLH